MGGLLTPPAGEREREGEQREARHAPRNPTAPYTPPATVSPSAAAALVTLRVKGAVMIAILASTFLCWTLEVRAASGTLGHPRATSGNLGHSRVVSGSLEQSRGISGNLSSTTAELNLVACIVRSPLR